MENIPIQIPVYLPVDERVGVALLNMLITINGSPATKFAGNYYCQPGDTIGIDGTLDLPDLFTVPVTLKMPLVRHADGKPTTDEIYLNVTITNSHVLSSGTIPWSGDWKVLIERNNKALEVIGAPFKIIADNLTFLA
jgi:hypothetical protein